MKGITLTEPKKFIEITKLKNNLSRLQTRDLITRYIIFEHCLKNSLATDEQYAQFINELSEQEIYKHLSSLIPKSYSQLLSEFRKNGKEIVDKMLKYQLGKGHSYIEPIFRKKKKNIQSQEHSEEKWEPVSDIKQHILENTEYKIFLFIADSGIGKTTFLWWLNKYILDNFEDKVPIYIHSSALDIPDWSNKLVKELERTEREADEIFHKSFLNPDDEEIVNFIKKTKQNKNLVLLIDGLNESRSSDFDRNVKGKFTDNIKILTTREEYIKEFERQNLNIPIQKIYISPFTVENIAEYLGKDYNKLKSKINENKELFQIPLVLRLAYEIYKSKGKLDFKNRFDLYTQIIEEAKESQGKKPQTNPVSFNELIEILPYISFKALSKGVIKRIDEKGKHKHFLAQTCKEYGFFNPYFQNVKGVMDAFKTYDSIFGLFTHQEGIFEYYHQSFQEYFAAYYLRENPEKIKKYLYHPLFKEVLIFLGGGLDTQKLKKLIEFLIHDGHEASEKKETKKLIWKNLEIASWLVMGASEKDYLIKFFWNSLEGKEILLKEYLFTNFDIYAITKIVNNLYNINLKNYKTDEKDNTYNKLLSLAVGYTNGIYKLKEKLALYLCSDINRLEDMTEIIHVNDFLFNPKLKNQFITALINSLNNVDNYISNQAIEIAIKFNVHDTPKLKESLVSALKRGLESQNSSRRSSTLKLTVEAGLHLNTELAVAWLDSFNKTIFDKYDLSIVGTIEAAIKGSFYKDKSIFQILKIQLIYCLCSPEEWVRSRAIDLMTRLKLPKDIDTKENIMLYSALKSSLIENIVLGERVIRDHAIDVLVELKYDDDFDKNTILTPVILKRLNSKNIIIRKNAIKAIAELGFYDPYIELGPNEISIDDIVSYLNNESDCIRAKAINAVLLLELYDDVKQEFDIAVVKNLDSQCSKLRQISIDAILKLGLTKKSNEDKLIDAIFNNLFDKYEIIRFAAINSMIQSEFFSSSTFMNKLKKVSKTDLFIRYVQGYLLEVLEEKKEKEYWKLV